MAAVHLNIAATDIPPRLAFLESLARREPFQGCAVLEKIIGDYRTALRKARGTDQVIGGVRP